MSYVNHHLMSGERVVRTTQLHWLIYFPAMGFLVLGVIVYAVIQLNGAAYGYGLVLPSTCLLAFALTGLPAFVRRRSAEFAVTNKRVVMKTGVVHRRSSEILLRQVEGITVDQSIWGRIFNFGTIVIEGTGSDRTPYRNIAAPLKFRLAVQEQIEANALQANDGSARQTPASASRTDAYTALLRLNELKGKGGLTEEEFQAEKRNLLG
jgi:uncharacterized membrane protein YdbT with pleckstrin-like domain